MITQRELDILDGYLDEPDKEVERDGRDYDLDYDSMREDELLDG